METEIIHQGDCIDVLTRSLDAQSIDLVFADPPYNLSGNGLKWENNQTGGDWYMMNEKWDQMSSQDYKLFTSSWINASKHVLKDGGSIYIACSYHNIGEVVTALKDVCLRINNIITWYKVNAMPNMTRRTFTHCTEFVVWCVKGSGWRFNYEQVREINPERQKSGERKQMRDVWSIPLVQGRERLKGPDGRALHPTQKPEELLRRIIVASTVEQDIVLDPFLGTGTTAVVAQRLNRRWIGIEKEPKYVELAKGRLDKENMLCTTLCDSL